MGGSSSSSDSSQKTRNNDFSTVDYRALTGGASGGYIDGNQTINAGGNVKGVTVNTSDFGAIKTGGEIAMTSIDFADKSNKRALDFAGKTNAQALDAITENAENDHELTKDLVSQSLGIVEKRSASQQEQLIGQFKQIFTIFIVGTGGTVAAIYYFRSR